MDEFPGAREEVLRLRASIVKGALGNDYENAVAVLDRTLLPCFEFATDLRLRYDPEYCDGSLDYVDEDGGAVIKNNIVGDLQAYGYRPSDIDRMQAHMADATKAMSSFTEYLSTDKHRWLFDDKPALRAARIMFHTNTNGMRKIFQDGTSADHCDAIDREIDKAAAQKETYSARLTCLRLHHQLTMLQIDGYKDLAKQLAYCD
jgi:hypothetical protein